MTIRIRQNPNDIRCTICDTPKYQNELTPMKGEMVCDSCRKKMRDDAELVEKED